MLLLTQEVEVHPRLVKSTVEAAEALLDLAQELTGRLELAGLDVVLYLHDQVLDLVEDGQSGAYVDTVGHHLLDLPGDVLIVTEDALQMAADMDLLNNGPGITYLLPGIVHVTARRSTVRLVEIVLCHAYEVEHLLDVGTHHLHLEKTFLCFLELVVGVLELVLEREAFRLSGSLERAIYELVHPASETLEAVLDIDDVSDIAGALRFRELVLDVLELLEEPGELDAEPAHVGALFLKLVERLVKGSDFKIEIHDADRGLQTSYEHVRILGKEVDLFELALEDELLGLIDKEAQLLDDLLFDGEIVAGTLELLDLLSETFDVLLTIV